MKCYSITYDWICLIITFFDFLYCIHLSVEIDKWRFNAKWYIIIKILFFYQLHRLFFTQINHQVVGAHILLCRRYLRVTVTLSPMLILNHGLHGHFNVIWLIIQGIIHAAILAIITGIVAFIVFFHLFICVIYPIYLIYLIYLIYQIIQSFLYVLLLGPMEFNLMLILFHYLFIDHLFMWLSVIIVIFLTWKLCLALLILSFQLFIFQSPFLQAFLVFPSIFKYPLFSYPFSLQSKILNQESILLQYILFLIPNFKFRLLSHSKTFVLFMIFNLVWKAILINFLIITILPHQI